MALPLTEERFPALKRLLICFSLANLFFVSAWYRIQDLQAPFANYFRESPPDLTILKATLLATLLLTAIFVAASFIAAQMPSLVRVWDCIFLAGVGIGLELARAGWPDSSVADHFRNGGAIGAEAAIACGLILRAVANKTIMVVAAQRVLLLFNFLFLALAVHFVSAWAATPPAADFASDSPAAATSGGTIQKPGPRVLWLLFDSMDQRLAFDARHPSLQLPELDRFRDESFWAAEAYSPARFTSYSVPGLLTGRLFQEANPESPNQIMLTPRGGGTPVSWASLPSIFFDVRKLGVDARVTGWYHPYCRIDGHDMVECHSELGVDARNTREAYATHLGVAGTVRLLLRRRVEDLLAGLHLAQGNPSELPAQLYAQKRQQEQYFAIRSRTLETLKRFSPGLYFVHWPTPHGPGLYDRRRASFDVSLTNDYLDNLALVNRTVADLRAAMQSAGLWENTTVIITADHGYRPEDWSGTAAFGKELQEAVGSSKSLTVPVLIHFPKQKAALRYAAPFNNVLLHDLALAMLRGEVTEPAQAANWLDLNRARFPTSPPQPIP